ncbi:MAG: PDZ domain-containing protein [Actinomycetota bacterium]|nr:PDZ domain-containing protein [Actinomycetota bacterium]
MTRRTATISVCAALLLGLLALAAVLPVPYVVLSPGPTENTIGAYDGVEVIVIEGRETFPTEGNLNLTTVSVTTQDREMNLLEALAAWIDPKSAVVPRGDIYDDDETLEEVRARNAEQMVTSQQSAIAAALRELDIPIAERVLVDSIVEDAPALDRLAAGDVILAVDGEEVATREDVVRLVTAHEPGESVSFTVDRSEEQLDIEVEAVESTDEPLRAVVGIGVEMGFDFPFEVEVTLAEQIGGPSAGLMFALGIVDKLTPGALNGGAFVAGTGTVEPDGTVGPIGGIQQKIAGAKDAGATTFLVPAPNCAAAVAADVSGIRLVRVAALSDAVDSLASLAAGNAALPAC